MEKVQKGLFNLFPSLQAVVFHDSLEALFHCLSITAACEFIRVDAAKGWWCC